MVVAVRRGQSLRAVAEKFGVGVATVAHWVGRAKGLRLDRVDFSDRSRAPHRTRRTVSRDINLFALRGHELLRREPVAPDRLEPLTGFLAPFLERSAVPTTAPRSCYAWPRFACCAPGVWYPCLPGETEAGSAGEQPDQGITRPTVRQGCISTRAPPTQVVRGPGGFPPLDTGVHAWKTLLPLPSASPPGQGFTSVPSPGPAAGSSAHARSAPRSCAASGPGSLSPAPRRRPGCPASP